MFIHCSRGRCRLATAFGNRTLDFISVTKVCVSPVIISCVLFTSNVPRATQVQVTSVSSLLKYSTGEIISSSCKCSILLSLFLRLKNNGISKIFESSHGYSDGDHERDFVYVGDCVKVNLWFLKKPKKSGLFNVGTGCAASFNQVCQEIINYV